MKKHMQDLSNKISRQGLEHNELWEARMLGSWRRRRRLHELKENAPPLPHTSYAAIPHFPSATEKEISIFYFSSSALLICMDEWAVDCL